MTDPFAALPEFPRTRLNEIVAEMRSQFGISEEEAVGRVRGAFGQWDFGGDPDAANHLGHEEPAFWANTVYYRDECLWWPGEPPAGLEPAPWPPRG